MIIFCITLFPNDRAHATPAEFGSTIEPLPVTDKTTDVVFAPNLTTVSTDSNIEVRVLEIFYFIFDI